MAHLQKFSKSDTQTMLRHYDRLISGDKNTDIDTSRTKFNYDLSPFVPEELRKSCADKQVRHHISKLQRDHYTERFSEVYSYNRKDTVASCSWIITLPKEITDKTEIKRFFQESYNFLEHRYGVENVIAASVHFDEGKTVKSTDSEGNVQTVFHIGQPHMHFLFIPVTKVDPITVKYKTRTGKFLPDEIIKDPESGRYFLRRTPIVDDNGKYIEKKGVPKALLNATEKVSAYDVINRFELDHFHPDLQNYLSSKGFSCNMHSGITRDLGGNISVSDLKSLTNTSNINLSQLISENKSLKLKVKELEKELEISKTHENAWGKSSSWGKEVDHTWDL